MTFQAEDRFKSRLDLSFAKFISEVSFKIHQELYDEGASINCEVNCVCDVPNPHWVHVEATNQDFSF